MTNYFRAIFITIFFCFFVLSAGAYAETITGQLPYPVWSGFWWPKNQGGLVNGSGYYGKPAPVSKYDMYLYGTPDGTTTSEFISKLYDQYAESWQGLCHAFSSAALSEHIDFKPSVHDNILFRIGDKKGLITLTHDRDVIDAQLASAATPVNLHYWLLKYIKEEGRGFFADFDPGEEYWSYPVYRFSMTSTNVSGGTEVECTVWSADDFVSPDYSGVKERQNTYTYKLYTENNAVVSGEWTGASIADHPQTLVLPGDRSSTLSTIDYDTVKKIATAQDDELEAGESYVDLPPGGYNLLLMDPDNYRINSLPGDEIRIGIKKIEGTGSDSFEILDGDSTILYTGSLQTVSQSFVVSSVKPPYYVKFYKSSYPLDNFTYYRLDFDLKSSNDFIVPKIKQSFSWNGMAVTNPTSEKLSNIYVTGYSQSGLPLQTYVGPFSLDPGSKRTFISDDFKIRAIDRSDFVSMKVHAPPGIKSVYLAGSIGKYMIGDSSGISAKRLVLPELPGPAGSKYVYWGVANPEFLYSNPIISVYGSDGAFYEEKGIPLNPGETAHFSNSLPESITNRPQSGWAEISGDVSFSAYTELYTSGSRIKSDNMPLVVPGKHFCVPHAETRSPWSTKLTIINVSALQNDISVKLCVGGGTFIENKIQLAPHAKKSLNIKDVFPLYGDDAISGSGLMLESSAEMAGYCSYENISDDLFCQFMSPDLLENEFVLPHAVTDSYWWTAVIFFNPNASDSELTITPYDLSGNILGGLEKQITIPSLTKNVSTMNDLFGNNASRVSFVRVSEKSGKMIYGFYAYGSHNGEMISGGTFK